MEFLKKNKIAQMVIFVLIVGMVLSNFGVLIKWILIGGVALLAGTFVWAYVEAMMEKDEKNS